MALGGEIASMFVRIRPNLTGFRGEATAGIKGALTEMQTQVAASTRANVASTRQGIQANVNLSESFRTMAASATSSWSEAGAAAQAGAARTVAAEDEVTAASERSTGALTRLRERVLNLGTLFGVGFGAYELIKFVKDVSGSAASVQKSVEVIKSAFGNDASQVVVGFGDRVAAGLGISAEAADSTSARLGILFKNIGVNQNVAARMTVGWEKFAGALATVRGKDPTDVLNRISLAASGKMLRGLAQMGVVVDQAQIKIAALRLGLIKTDKDAITPAVRAETVYALATARLPELLQQAAKHSGDFATVQHKLSAEWSNSKDIIGTALLPVFTRYITRLANWVEKMNKSGALQHAVNRVLERGAQIVHGITEAFKTVSGPVSQAVGALGGFKKAVRDIIIAWGAFKAVSIAGGIASIARELAAIPLPVLGVLALGAAFVVAYHKSAKFRDIVNDVKDAIQSHLGPALNKAKAVLERVAHSIQANGKAIGKALEPAVGLFRSYVALLIAIWDRFGGTIKKLTRIYFTTLGKEIQASLHAIIGIVDLFSALLTGKWGKAWGALKQIASSALDGVSAAVKGWGGVVMTIFKGVWTNIEIGALEGVKKVLNVIGKIPTSFTIFGHRIGFENPAKRAARDLGEIINNVQAARAAQAAMRQSIEQSKQNATNAAAEVQAKVGAGAARTAGAVAEGTKRTARETSRVIVETAHSTGDAATAAGKAAAKAVLDAAASSIKEARDQVAALKQQLRDAIKQNAIDLTNAVNQAKQNLISVAGTLASSIGQAIDQPFVLAGQKIKEAQDKLAVIFDSKTAKLDAQSRALHGLTARLQAQSDAISRMQARAGLRADVHSLESLRTSLVLPGGGQLSTDPKKALAQLEALAKKHKEVRGAIQDFITKYQAAVLTVQSDRVGIKQSAVSARQAAIDRRRQVLDDARAGRESPLTLRGERLAVEQDAADRRKTAIQRRLSDLAVELTSHKIKIGEFNRQVAHLLGGQRQLYHQAGKLLGVAFRQGLESQVKGFLDQAQAIVSGPRRPGSGQEPTIVRPLQTLEKGNRDVQRITREIGHAQITLQRRIAKATEQSAKAAKKAEALAAKKAAGARAAKDVKLGPTAADLNPGRQTTATTGLAGTT